MTKFTNVTKKKNQSLSDNKRCDKDKNFLSGE
jgi:hypothetical protein